MTPVEINRLLGIATFAWFFGSLAVIAVVLSWHFWIKGDDDESL
jgi:hypothetical protein